MERWWIKHAERWKREQEALDAAGIRFTEDPAANVSGKLVLHLSMEWGGQPLRLTAHFPTNYPSFPPMVVAPDLRLRRHQTLGSHQLCLLKNEDDWNVGSDTLANLITEQLPRIFQSQPEVAGDERFEAHEGEPLTIYLEPEPSSFIGFPSFEIERLSAQGTLRLKVDSFRPLRGTVLDVRNADGIIVAENEVVVGLPPDRNPIVTGRWIKLNSRPALATPAEYYALAKSFDPAFETPHWQSLRPGEGPRIDLVALLFSDELEWRESAGNTIVISKRKEPGQPVKPTIHRTELESRANYFVRDSKARSLQAGTIALVGLGSLGSCVAKRLAQCGIGELRLMDQDVLDAGNAIRWEIGRSAAGYPKASLLQSWIQANFPYTKVIGLHGKLGYPTMSVREESAIDDLIFKGTDCVVDASASLRVMQYLSDTARARGVPYVWLYAGNGGWGGLVGRTGNAGNELCWGCHMHYLSNVGFDQLPAAPEADVVQPPGCAHATFVGSQVDMEEVALMGVRLALDEILVRVRSRTDRAYTWNFAMVRLRDAHGEPMLPVWTPYSLPPHDHCPNH